MMKKIFLFFILVFSLSFASTTGTTTMQWPNSAYFLFSTGETESYDAALLVSDNPPEYYDISLEPWVEPGWCTNFIDMGEVSLDSLETPPTSGYNDDELGFLSCEYVEQNHVYWIKTRDGEYAKVKITEAVHLGSDPDYGNVNRITFDWVYLGGFGTSTTEGGSKNDNNDDGFCPISTSLVLLSMLSLFTIKH